MSEAEVRKTYKGVLHKDRDVQEQTDYLIDDHQKLEYLPAQVKLRLDKNSKTLSGVALVMKDPFVDLTDDNAAGDNSLAVISLLNRDLAEKYGRPVTEEGEGNLTAAMVVRTFPAVFACKKMWKSEGQNIRLDWYFLDTRLTAVILVYTPLPKDI